MLPTNLQDLTLIPARELSDENRSVPDRPGVYLFFFNQGMRLLRATAYLDCSGRKLASVKGWQHLYTGAAMFSLRARLQTNLRADVTSSSLCRSLLAIEYATGAISKSGTPASDIKGERSLAAWLSANSLIGFEITDDPFGRETELLSEYSSPLNIALRRGDPYSRTLSEWRCAAFPADKPERARHVRYA